MGTEKKGKQNVSLQVTKSSIKLETYSARSTRHYNASYAIITVTSLMKTEHYFAYFHSIMSHGVIWENSTDTIKEFRIQKKLIRIIVGLKEKSLVGKN
jgi:hypothetical protein